MIEVLPWKYNYNPNQKLTIIYGKDNALALSLANMTDIIHIPTNEVENNCLFLFTEPLIPYEKPIKIISNLKLMQNIINLSKNHDLLMNCILIIDLPNIKCDLVLKLVI